MPGAEAGKGNLEAIRRLQITTKTTCNATNFELSSGHRINLAECEFEEISTSEN
jgi:hypothetical protein